jgi:hypothetical protein
MEENKMYNLEQLVDVTHQLALIKVEEDKIYSDAVGDDSKLKATRARRHELIELTRELENEFYAITNYLVKVGDGVTEYMYSDKHAYTVIARTKFSITIQRDKAIRTDERGMSDSQNYDYERNTDGKILVARWSKKRGRFQVRSSVIGLGRHEYYDYSF